MILQIRAGNTLTILFSSAEQEEHGIQCGVSMKEKHPLFKSREDGMYEEKKMCLHEWSECKVQNVEPCQFERDPYS